MNIIYKNDLFAIKITLQTCRQIINLCKIRQIIIKLNFYFYGSYDLYVTKPFKCKVFKRKFKHF